MNVIYPLGHSNEELKRLDSQARLLHDTKLDKLLVNTTSCLEIGCGHGSNFLLLKSINPSIHYTGIDISVQAIQVAKNRFSKCRQATFLVQDAFNMTPKNKYDLILIKLVLWSLGSNWRQILLKAREWLTKKGVLYILEPCNQFIQFYPPKKLVSKWMKKWDEKARKQGFNPYIGVEIPSALLATNYSHVETEFFPIIGLGNDPERYQAIVNNLEGFYLGEAVQKMTLTIEERKKTKIKQQWQKITPDSFVMDALVASWAIL